MSSVLRAEYVGYLLGLLQTNMAYNISLKPFEKADNYHSIKEVFLECYKLNSEKLRQLFFWYPNGP